MTRGNSGRERDEYDPEAQPARVVTHSLKDVVVRTGNNSRRLAGNHENWRDSHAPFERSVDEPSPTVDGKFAFTLHTKRGQDADGNRQTRETSAPAPTLSAKAGGQWWWQQPSTTLGGDPRVSPRCHHDEGMQGAQALSAAAAAAGEGDGNEPIRLTIRDALILQSFPPDYPVQGTKTSQFRQIGNAVPPMLSRVVLRQFVEFYQPTVADARAESRAEALFAEEG